MGFKNERTHIIDENRGVLGSYEEWSVGGILEVASVFLKGSFVQSLLEIKKSNCYLNRQENIQLH